MTIVRSHVDHSFCMLLCFFSELMCQEKECVQLGITTISSYLDIKTFCIDPPLYFCSHHIKIFSEWYSMYKALESSDGFGLLRAQPIFWEVTCVETLVEIRNLAEIALKLRRKFQSNL